MDIKLIEFNKIDTNETKPDKLNEFNSYDRYYLINKLIKRNNYLENLVPHLIKNLHNANVANKSFLENYKINHELINNVCYTTEDLEQNISSESICNVCYKNIANVYFDTCKHKICLLCAETNANFTHTCPYDRQNFNNIRCLSCDQVIHKAQAYFQYEIESEIDSESEDEDEINPDNDENNGEDNSNNDSIQPTLITKIKNCIIQYSTSTSELVLYSMYKLNKSLGNKGKILTVVGIEAMLITMIMIKLNSIHKLLEKK